MAESKLRGMVETVVAAGDGITIVAALTDIPGGVSLNVERYQASLEAYAAKHPDAAEELAAAVYAGTPVGRDAATGEYAALPLGADGAFTLPAGLEAVGVTRSSVPLHDARTGVVTAGQVNWAAMPLKVPAAVRAALPRIEFLHVAESAKAPAGKAE